MPTTVCLSFDFDAMSVWFGMGVPPTPAMMHRGEFGARVGVPRILDLLTRHELPATFFVPGHTVESFPEQTERVLAAGHEVAHHSYAHQDPSTQTPDEERADFERALAVLAAIGVVPQGFRSPSADVSALTLTLLEEHGFRYDSSLQGDDARPYRPRIGDVVSATEPLHRGREAALWELPMSFELDDWPHFQFAFQPYRTGLSAPSKVLEIWRGEFDWTDTYVENGLVVLCLHPQVIGRGHRLAMLETFIEHCRARGARFSTLAAVAAALPAPGGGAAVTLGGQRWVAEVSFGANARALPPGCAAAATERLGRDAAVELATLSGENPESGSMTVRCVLAPMAHGDADKVAERLAWALGEAVGDQLTGTFGYSSTWGLEPAPLPR